MLVNGQTQPYQVAKEANPFVQIRFALPFVSRGKVKV